MMQDAPVGAHQKSRCRRKKPGDRIPRSLSSDNILESPQVNTVGDYDMETRVILCYGRSLAAWVRGKPGCVYLFVYCPSSLTN